MIPYSVKIILPILSLSTFLFSNTVMSQNQSIEEGGIIITEKGDITTHYDKFTGQFSITVNDVELLSSLNEDNNDSTTSYVIPYYVYGGDIFNEFINALIGLSEWEDEFNLILVRKNSQEIFFEEEGPKIIPFLIDNQRLSKSGYFLMNSSTELIEITFSLNEWQSVVESKSSEYRVNGEVFSINDSTKDLMGKILYEYESIQSELNKNKKNNHESAAYDLKWEGDLDRSPMVQPLPSNITNLEGVVSVRFEVRPDGTVGRIIPLRKLDSELEQEVNRTLRNWKFSRLPAGAPQQAQWGTITFRFVFN